MSPQAYKHKLTAILSADVAGYSRQKKLILLLIFPSTLKSVTE